MRWGVLLLVAACGGRTELGVVVRDDAGAQDVGLLDVVAPPTLRAFVTTRSYAASLGGLAGADGICAMEAASAGLSGKYAAWLSDSTGSPSTRFVQSPSGWVRTDGQVFAASWTSLVGGHPLVALELGPDGQVPTGDDTAAWTSTNPDGTLAPCSGCGMCHDWTSTAVDELALTGAIDLATSGWTSDLADNCGQFKHHLYCFEQ